MGVVKLFLNWPIEMLAPVSIIRGNMSDVIGFGASGYAASKAASRTIFSLCSKGVIVVSHTV